MRMDEEISIAYSSMAALFSPTRSRDVSLPPMLMTQIIDELFASVKDDIFFEAQRRFHPLLHKTFGQSNEPIADMYQFVNVAGKTLLHHACTLAKVSMVRFLVSQGSQPTAKCPIGRTPFHDCISSHSERKPFVLEMVKILFESDPNGLSIVDDNGVHVIHLAAIHGCLDVLKWYQDLQACKRIPMDITSFRGRTVLHYACYNCRMDIIEWLLPDSKEINANRPLHDIASLDANGNSALHYAVLGNHLEVCEWLILHAPTRQVLSINSRNNKAEAPVDIAPPDTKLYAFLSFASQPAWKPMSIFCIGSDSHTLGISWKFPTSGDTLLDQVVAPQWLEIEYCKRPKELTITQSFFSTIRSESLQHTPSSPDAKFHWVAISCQKSEHPGLDLSLRISPDASQYWIAGLQPESEYFVRLRARNRNGYGAFAALSSGLFTQSSQLRIDRNSCRGKEQRKNLVYPTSLLKHMQKPGSQLLSRPRASCDTTHQRIERNCLGFIGTLQFEILAARNLNLSFVQSQSHAKTTYHANSGVRNIFTQVSLNAAPRTCSSPFIKPPECQDSMSHLYRVQSLPGRLQKHLVFLGSRSGFRHCQIDFYTIFCIPDTKNATLTVEIFERNAYSRNGMSIGFITIPVPYFITGMPEKMEWFALQHPDQKQGYPSYASASTMSCGQVLLRTYFLPDGVRPSPHPRVSSIICTETTADNEEPLDEMQVYSVPTDEKRLYDPYGFRIVERNHLKHHAAAHIHPPRYYQLHLECILSRQETLWTQYHRHFHSTSHIQDYGNQKFSDLLDHDCDCQLTNAQHCPYSESIGAIPGSDHERYARETLRELIWMNGGIPLMARRKLYMNLSGATRLQKSAFPANKSYHTTLVDRIKYQLEIDSLEGNETPFLVSRRQILIDLNRTFAGQLCWITCSDGQAALERVLLAYALHNSTLGYCQSMSHIAGRLLCLFDLTTSKSPGEISSEECVFWLLSVVCEAFFPLSYIKGMKGIRLDAMLLETLIDRRLPTLARYFRSLQAPHVGLLLATNWFLPLFCTNFPSETCYQLLDIIMLEGPDVVFAIAIALLRMAQNGIMQQDLEFMQLISFLKERDKCLYDVDLLMEIVREEWEVVGPEIAILRKNERLRKQDNKLC
uniref:Putative RabGAP/TBC domaincontaining protein n=1 Tax=Albugo laibachii Nc14 TaxID=890382 RepID=F0WED4_9STRA|nr:putative RabGAP/TBC domaincontaining protein [Albugo laibachii Nc14]|eukprot:CCA19566.1 putative RabGAP/TBC domaincontaining protein [Albugo laibachii Nc14]